MSRILLCLIYILLLTDPSDHEESFCFKYPINNIAVGRNYVTVATENCLYQFNRTLNRIKTTGPHGENDTVCMEEKVSTHKKTFYNKILLDYNDTVLTCWNEGEGSCIELHMSNLTAMGKREKGIVPQGLKHGARGLILFKEKSINFIVAKFTTNEKDAEETIVLREKEGGGFIFIGKGSTASLKKSTAGLNYVDALQWKNKFIFPYYPSVGSSARVVVLTENKFDLEFHTQSNLKCGSKPERNIILSSFAFHSSEGFLWAGIFSTNSTASTDRTAICLYNFTLLAEQPSTCIQDDFFFLSDQCTNSTDLVPLYKNPILTHGDLTAVHVTEVDRKLVFFLGTENGKLLKFTLKGNYDANCPEVLYTFKDGMPVFEKIHLDPVDFNYLYVATVKEIKRLKIAKCEQYESCNDCLSAHDPHCGWCHSNTRCTMKTECEASTAQGKWIGFSERYGTCLKIKVLPKDGKISASIEKNPLLLDENAPWNCKIINKDKRETLCTGNTNDPSLNCSCQFSADKTFETATLTAEAQSKNLALSAQFQFQKCSQYSEFRCLDCIASGCIWCTTTSSCTSPNIQCRNEDYADEEKCRVIEQNATQRFSPNVSITFVAIDRVSSAGMKDIFISGENLQDLPRVLLFGASSCKPQVLKVFNKNSTHALISLPQSENKVQRLCVDFSGNCYKNSIMYESVSCSAIVPNTVWLSGGRNLSVSGRNLNFIENIIISRYMHPHNTNTCLGNATSCHFQAPKLGENPQTYNVNLRIQDSTLICGELIYKKDPVFNTFYVLNDNSNEIELLIEKADDDLAIQAHEIDIQIHYKDMKLSCKVWNVTVIKQNSIQCKASNVFKEKFDARQMFIKIKLGNYNVELKPENQKQNYTPYFFILLVVPLLVIVVIAAYLITRHKSKELSKKLSKDLVELECEIRKEIREGFAELQTDKEVVTMEALGTIPFFDYKHFALNTFFPESDKNREDLFEKLCENIPSPFQTRRSTQDEEIVKTMKTLFENQNFLVLLIHTLEKQNDFTIKDRCMFASFLTINFQSNLLYLTGLLERLTKDLIEQSSNKHPKLMLRRTETVVEKLLTNWMSTCLYGFLRESVGEPLYNLVYTLNQRIHKGPIDAVTSKALYTLNEDWLLWQITEFSSVEINVQFPKPPEHDDEDNSHCIKVTVLDCDTIGQVKEKILQAFQMGKGYNFGHPLSDIGLELHHGQTFKELLDIDSSNMMNDNNIIKLNTIKHYQVK